MPSLRILPTLLLSMLFVPALHAQESLVGQKVLPKAAGAKLMDGDQVAGDFKTLPGYVRQVRGEWLLVDAGPVGYIQRSDVLTIDEAVAYFGAQVRANPQSAYAYGMRGIAWQYKGEYDIAIRDYTEAIRLDPSVAGYIHRGNAWRDKKEYDKAIGDYDEAIRLKPSAACYNNRGNAWQAKKEHDKAIGDYDEAIRLDPKYALPFNNRGNAWCDKKEYDKAIGDYDEAIRLDPKYATAFYNRGNAWKVKKEYDKAIADYDEAIRLDPKHAYAFNNRGNAWRDKKVYDKAIADYEQAIRLDPKHANAFYNRGWLWATCPDARFRDGKKAVESATRACELTSWKNDIFIGTLSACYAEAGDFDQAIRWLTKAMEMNPDYAKDVRAKMLENYRKRMPYREEDK